MTALVALVQVGAARTGSASPLSSAAGAVALGAQEVLAATVGGVRNAGITLLSLPGLESQNAALHARNQTLQQENLQLREALAAYGQRAALQPSLAEYPHAVQARVIGFPPEEAVQSVTIDKGTRNGIRREDGVLAPGGVVGRVVEAGPLTSKVALITDFTSTIPALVQRGRYWGIARGNQSSVRLEYVSQDAPLRVGELVVTGEARSFHSGALIGTIVRVERSDSNLYQTAVVKPAANLAALDRVIVLTK